MQNQPLFADITVIDEENKHLFPREIQDVYEQVFKKIDKQVFFPEKYYAGMFSVLQRDLIALHQSDPEKPIKTVVADIVASLPNFIPPDKVLEVAEFTVKKWQELAQAVELETA